MDSQQLNALILKLEAELIQMRMAIVQPENAQRAGYISLTMQVVELQLKSLYQLRSEK